MFRFKALRTRHISCMLHLSEVRFTTRPVIPMDMDGLRWIPMDPIGFHSTNRYRWITSDNISALYDFHLTSGTLSRQSYLLPLEGVKNIILPIPSENYVSHRFVLKMYGKKSISTFSFLTAEVKEKQNRKLDECNEIRNNREIISGEV